MHHAYVGGLSLTNWHIVLVMGMCFFAGGTRFSEQGFGISASQINSSLLALAVIAVLLPAAFDSAVRSGTSDSNGNTRSISDPDFQQDILHLSHGIAIILLLSKRLSFPQLPMTHKIIVSLCRLHSLPALDTHSFV